VTGVLLSVKAAVLESSNLRTFQAANGKKRPEKKARKRTNNQVDGWGRRLTDLPGRLSGGAAARIGNGDTNERGRPVCYIKSRLGLGGHHYV